MNVLELNVFGELRNGTRARFYPIGDPHIDVKTANNRRLRKYLEHIAADEHSFAVCVGDIFNGSLPGHKFFSSKALKGDVAQHTDDYVNYVIEMAVKLFQPLVTSGTPTVVMRGNHDKWVKGIDIVRMLVGQLNCPTIKYGGAEAMVRVKIGSGDRETNTWRLHAAHGAGGGYLPGGKVTRFANTASHIADADIFVRGHVHDGAIRILPRYGINLTGTTRLTTRPVAYVTTPSFNSERVEGHTDYAAEMSLPPIDNGVQFLEIVNPRNKGDGDSRTHAGKLLRHEWEE